MEKLKLKISIPFVDPFEVNLVLEHHEADGDQGDAHPGYAGGHEEPERLHQSSLDDQPVS